MFNPLAPFDLQALEGLTKEGHRFFVRQQFSRAKTPFDEGIKGCFLFCHYREYPKAKEHYDVLADDPFRKLYNWEEDEDREKLVIAASGPAGFKVYSNTFLPDWEKHLTRRLKEKIKAYILQLGWKPGNSENITPVFYPYFGEVYVSLRFKKQEVRVKLEEIENG